MIRRNAACLTPIIICPRAGDDQGYWYLVAPAWLHGGWVAAATLVNLNLLFVEDRYAEYT